MIWPVGLIIGLLLGADQPVGRSVGRPARIGPEDTITIQALSVEEISRAWRVTTTGDVNLPMLGRVRVVGMTAEETEQRLTQLLGRFVKQPHVAVYISEFRSQPVTVSGAVARPGTVQLEGAATLFEALVRAGGAKDTAGNVKLTRKADLERIDSPGVRTTADGQYQVLEAQLAEVTDPYAAAANIPIRAYDVVSVAEARVQKLVHIAGEVNKPGSVELVTQESVSCLKVLAMAGGLSRTAAPKKTLILHTDEKGVQTTSAVVDLRKILSGRAHDLELIPGDVVIVPSSQAMTYIQAASVAAVSASIYMLGTL